MQKFNWHITYLSSLLLLGLMINSTVSYSQNVNDLISFAKKKLGAPYSYGGKGPDKFDCSGYTQYVFKEFNIKLNASSALQYEQGDKVKLKRVKVGDLIFFKSSNANSNNVGHVGIICETNQSNDTVCFIHASTSNGVRIDQYPGYQYYNDRFVGCRRVINWLSSEDKEENNNDNNSKDQELIPEDPIIAPEIVDDNKNKKGIKDSIIPNPTPKPQPTPRPQKKVKIHIVKKGETLYRIAKKHKCSVEEIIEWNNIEGYNIKIGQELIVSDSDLPQKDKKEKKNSDKPEPKKENKTNNKNSPKENGDTNKDESIIYHTVKKGETLYRLSKLYKCDVKDLEDWNNLKSNNIQIGQILIIHPRK